MTKVGCRASPDPSLDPGYPPALCRRAMPLLALEPPPSYLEIDSEFLRYFDNLGQRPAEAAALRSANLPTAWNLRAHHFTPTKRRY